VWRGGAVERAADDELSGGDAQRQGESDVRLLVLDRVDDREQIPERKVDGDARPVPGGSRAETHCHLLVDEAIDLAGRIGGVAQEASGGEVAASKLGEVPSPERRHIAHNGGCRRQRRERLRQPAMRRLWRQRRWRDSPGC